MAGEKDAPWRSLVTSPALCALLVALQAAAPARAGEPPSPAELQALFAEAVDLQRKGDLDGAVAAYRKLLEARPRNVEARSNLGAALARQGLTEPAIEQYREALAVDPARTAVRLNLAVALQKAGRLREAAAELGQVVRERPEERNPVVLLAECHARLGEYGQAVVLLSPLAEKYTDDRAIAYLLGLALVQNRQAEKGKVYLDQILRDGDSAEARLLMGTMKSAVGEYASARDDLARAAELRPDLPLVHAQLGRALMSMGETEAAAAEFRKELAANPNDFDANLLLGILVRQGQGGEEAMALFRRAAAVRPGAPEALYQVGSLALERGETDDARQVLETVVAAAPEFTEAHVSLATAYYRLKRKADGDRERALAQELARKAQEREPGALAPGEGYRGEPVALPTNPKPKPPESRE
jgi:tetratricopeptide (TPR) repeat protein